MHVVQKVIVANTNTNEIQSILLLKADVMCIDTMIRCYYPYGQTSIYKGPYTIIIGAFDGMHSWHQELRKKAYTYPDPIGVLTFDPPPKAYFDQRIPFQSFGSKYYIFTQWKTSAIYVLSFDNHLAKLSAIDFIKSCLSVIPIARLIVWQDFRFGHQQQWDTTMLQQYYTCDVVWWSDSKTSSSDLRKKYQTYDDYLNN